MPLRPKPLTPTLLKKTLQKTLAEAGPVAVLGIGSELRGDDVAGILVARRLKRSCSRSGSRCAVFEGGTAPENMTGDLIRFIRERCAGAAGPRGAKPAGPRGAKAVGLGGTGAVGHVVLVDTADMKLRPGSICILGREDLAGVSFSTHQLPLSVLADYLLESLPVDVIFVAIQPRTVSFGRALSPAGERAVETVVSALRGAIPSTRAPEGRGERIRRAGTKRKKS